VTDSLYADLPPIRPDGGVGDVGWVRELLRQSAIPVAEDELAAVAEVYQEYERLAAVIDAVDLPPASVPAITTTVLDQTP
jgi:hypothetical protein